MKDLVSLIMLIANVLLPCWRLVEKLLYFVRQATHSMAGPLQYLENGQNKIHRLYSSAFGASSDSAGTSEIFASSVAVSFLDTSSKFSTRSGTSSSSSSSMLLAASMAPPTPAPPTLLASLFR